MGQRQALQDAALPNLSIMSIRVREERYILSPFWSMGRAAGAGTTLAIDNIDKVRVGHSRSELSRKRALSHSAAASRSSKEPDRSLSKL